MINQNSPTPETDDHLPLGFGTGSKHDVEELIKTSRRLERERNELLHCMEFLREVITDEPIADEIESVGWNHENGTPIEWLDWCLECVSPISLDNAQSDSR